MESSCGHEKDKISKTFKKTIYSNILILLIIIMLEYVDLFSYGFDLFKIDESYEGEKVLSELSFIIFISSSCFGTIIYNFFSDIDYPIVVSITFDYVLGVKRVVRTIVSEVKIAKLDNAENVIIVMVMVVSSIIAFILSLIYLFIATNKLGKYTKKVPLIALSIITSISGILLLKTPFSDFYYPDKFSGYRLLLLIGGTIFVALIGFCAELIFKISFVLPIIALFYIVLSLLLKRIISQDHYNQLLVNQNVGDFSILNYFNIFSKIKFEYISFRILFKCIPCIFSSVIACIIGYCICISSYITVSKSNANINNEYLTQGITNILGTLLNFPNTLVPSYSLFIFGMHNPKKVTAYLSAVFILLFSFVIKYIVSYIPKMLSSSILCYFGISYIYNFMIIPLFSYSSSDIIGLFIGITLGLCVSFEVGFIFGLLYSSYTLLTNSLTSLQKTDKTSNILLSEYLTNNLEANSVIINYVACNLTIETFSNDLSKIENGDVIDLRQCNYIDVDANIELIRFLKEHIQVKIIGTPSNLYVWSLQEYRLENST